jgi:ABC-type nickel/cobalt efflux system permease component RcnA
MVNDTLILMWTALSIGFFHTLVGPDHYLPFIVMAKVRRWSLVKTTVITFLCGLAHVGSSVVLGFLGLAAGIAVFKLKAFESMRGEVAAWLLLAFGFTYFVWGVHRAIRNRPHRHIHDHRLISAHEHTHSHSGEHTHMHKLEKKADITPWVIFTIFVFGPCEPLIPILMYPAAKGNMSAVFMVTAIFGIATILTMLSLVLTISFGLLKIPLARMERYSHALAGFAILMCGVAIKFLGL